MIYVRIFFEIFDRFYCDLIDFLHDKLYYDKCSTSCDEGYLSAKGSLDIEK